MIKTLNNEALVKIWSVLQEIDEQRDLGSEGNKVRLKCYPSNYGIGASEQYEAKKNILDKLSSLEAINNLHKVKVNRIDGDILYWAFLIGNNYEEIISSNFGKSKPEQELQRKTFENLSKQKQISMVKKIINSLKFGKKEERLLTILLDFKPHQMGQLVKNQVSNSPNALSKLKIRVNKKLSQTGFFIDSLDGSFTDPTGSYQLKYLIDSD